MSPSHPTVQDLADVMGRIAPLEFAESWDRVGLQVGDPSRPLKGPVLLTIDLTPGVLDEAIRHGAGAIIAYHPPIWEPLKRITAFSIAERTILRAVEAGIAIYSPHTALDAIPGGVADWLCQGLGQPGTGTGDVRAPGDCRALTPLARKRPTEEVKVVTFVPHAQADRVREALASAGAGIIGNYNVCSFELSGSGTFFGGEGAKPATGAAGTLQRVAEIRIEMVCSKAALPLAIETLRRFHPYEEPAIDVYELLPRPDRYVGPGRRLVLDHAATVRELAERLKVFLGISDVRIALPGDDVPVSRIGACPGSGGSLATLARQAGCELYVTGEMNHHEVKAMVLSGVAVLLAGHTNTERGYLPVLARRLEAEKFAAPIIVSSADKDPLVTV
ncbi:MAG: Nif3-like dinuclear metal center hexameric protein [Phycisphaerales bacterium]